jgi:hypothetical protein
MEIMIPGGTGAENHRIVIESSQPVVIPGGVRSAQTPNPAMIGAKNPRWAIADLRFARRLPAGGAEPRPLAYPQTRQLARLRMTAEITPRRDARR